MGLALSTESAAPTGSSSAHGIRFTTDRIRRSKRKQARDNLRTMCPGCSSIDSRSSEGSSVVDSTSSASRESDADWLSYDYPFENIVLSGGGMKGYAYLGAVRVSIRGLRKGIESVTCAGRMHDTAWPHLWVLFVYPGCDWKVLRQVRSTVVTQTDMQTTEGHTDRQTDRQVMDRHTDTTKRQTDTDILYRQVTDRQPDRQHTRRGSYR